MSYFILLDLRYYAALDYIVEYGGGINMKKDTHDYTAVQYFKEHGVQPFHFMKVLFSIQLIIYVIVKNYF